MCLCLCVCVCVNVYECARVFVCVDGRQGRKTVDQQIFLRILKGRLGLWHVLLGTP